MLIFSTIFQAHGLIPRSPFPFFHTPKGDSEFCLEVTPIASTSKANIRCYGLIWNDKVERKRMWEVETEFTYPGEVFLSRKGESMVCLSFPDSFANSSELEKRASIKFYVNGKMISSVSLNDLVEINTVKRSSYHTEGYEVFRRGGQGKRGLVYGDSDAARALSALSLDNHTDNGDLFYITCQGIAFFYRMIDGKLIAKISELEPSSR